MPDDPNARASYRLYSLSEITGRLQAPALDINALTEKEARDLAFAASAIGAAELWRGEEIIANYPRRKG
jgi:hypothetical protein